MTSSYLSSPFKDPSPPHSQPELLGLWTPQFGGDSIPRVTHADYEAGGGAWGQAGRGREWGDPPGGEGGRWPSASTPAAPERATLQAASPRTGSMPGVLPRAGTAGLGGGGARKRPPSCRRRPEAPARAGPRQGCTQAVSTTLGQAAKRLLGLDARPDSRPHPAPTGRGLHTWAGTEPEARNCPQGWQEQITKEQNRAAARGLSQRACPPAPTLVARRVGLRGWRLRATWIFPRGRGPRRILAPGGAQVGTGAESRGRIPGTNPSLGTFGSTWMGGQVTRGPSPPLHLCPVLVICPRGPPTASLQTDIKLPRPRGNRAPPRLAAGTDPLSRLPVQ